MKTLVDAFKQFLTARRMSENTVRSYMVAVYTFNNIYKGKLTRRNVDQYQQFLVDKYRPKSANLRIIAFNKFLTFAGHDELKMHLVKCQQAYYLDDIIGYPDYLRFKAFLKAERDQKWYFVVWTLAATGVRVSELVQLRAEHVFDGMIDIRSKGNKVRRIYLPHPLQQQLISWLTDQQRLRGPLFVNHEGQAISIRGITKGLARCADRYGIDRHLVHPHAFRHLFAKKFLETKNDLTMLADLLGHESLDTTKIYLRMTSQEQRNIIDQIVDW